MGSNNKGSEARIELIQFPPSEFAGNYTGTVRTSFTGTARPVNTANSKIAGQVDAQAGSAEEFSCLTACWTSASKARGTTSLPRVTALG